MGRATKRINLGYPETLHKVIFLQASWIFVKFFDLFRPFIPQNLLKKIQIVTDRKTALNYLDKTQVPTYFCGTMEDEKDMRSLPLFVMNAHEVRAWAYLLEW